MYAGDVSSLLDICTSTILSQDTERDGTLPDTCRMQAIKVFLFEDHYYKDARAPQINL